MRQGLAAGLQVLEEARKPLSSEDFPKFTNQSGEKCHLTLNGDEGPNDAGLCRLSGIPWPGILDIQVLPTFRILYPNRPRCVKCCPSCCLTQRLFGFQACSHRRLPSCSWIAASTKSPSTPGLETTGTRGAGDDARCLAFGKPGDSAIACRTPAKTCVPQSSALVNPKATQLWPESGVMFTAWECAFIACVWYESTNCCYCSCCFETAEHDETATRSSSTPKTSITHPSLGDFERILRLLEERSWLSCRDTAPNNLG